jgi:hypothetical protein
MEQAPDHGASLKEKEFWAEKERRDLQKDPGKSGRNA